MLFKGIEYLILGRALKNQATKVEVSRMTGISREHEHRHTEEFSFATLSKTLGVLFLIFSFGTA